MQVPICDLEAKERRDCIERIGVNSSDCLKPCTGLSLTSFLKSKPEKSLDKLIPKELKAYHNYVKPNFDFPTGLKGMLCIPYYMNVYCLL